MALEERPSGRYEGLALMVDESSKLNHGEDEDDLEEVIKKPEVEPPSSEAHGHSKGKEVAIKPFEPKPRSQEEDHVVEETRYPTRVRKPL